MTLYRAMPPIDCRPGLCEENLSGDHTRHGGDPREFWNGDDFRREQEFLRTVNAMSDYMTGVTKAVLRKNEMDERHAARKAASRGD